MCKAFCPPASRALYSIRIHLHPTPLLTPPAFQCSACFLPWQEELAWQTVSALDTVVFPPSFLLCVPPLAPFLGKGEKNSPQHPLRLAPGFSQPCFHCETLT